MKRHGFPHLPTSKLESLAPERAKLSKRHLIALPTALAQRTREISNRSTLKAYRIWISDSESERSDSGGLIDCID